MLYDAIVVGSGPGGAMSAATLAGRGKAVLLVDRQPFPRDKVCGDGLPGNVMELLAQVGIDIHRTGLKHQQIYGIDLLAPSGKSLLVRERAKKYYSMVSPRQHFDTMLHHHALQHGAHFEVMDVDGPLYAPDGQRVVGIVQRQGTAKIEHEARVVIAADGASSAMVRSLRGRVSDPPETALAIRAYARLRRPLQTDPTVYFKYLRGLLPGYAWLFPTGRDTVNIGVGLFDQALYKQRGTPLKTLLSGFIDSLQHDFPLELEPNTTKSWPIPVWTNHASRVIKGVYLVGDAGRFVDALTGGGIYPAMVTGQLAAQAALFELEGLPHSQAAAMYDTRWRGSIGRSLQRLLWVQRWIGSRPAVLNTLVEVALALPPLRNSLMVSLAGQHA
jgi:menaquinone-9 beta-reductase